MASTFEELKLNSIDSALNTAPQLLEDSLAVALPTKKSITGFTSNGSTNTNLLDPSGSGVSTDVTNYNSGLLYIVSTATTGSYAVQSAYDNAFAVGGIKNLQIQELDVSNANPIGSAITPTIATRVFNLNLQCINFIRVNMTIGATGVTAYLVLSYAPYFPTYTNVQQAFPASLQTLATLSSGTLNTLNALSTSTLVGDITSGAISATTTSSNFTPTVGLSYEISIAVTAVSGSSPAMGIEIQESADTGNTWYSVYVFPPITAIGNYISCKIPYTGNRIRYIQTISAGASFTRGITRFCFTDLPSTPVRIYRTGGIEVNDISLYGKVLEIAVNNMTSNVIYLQLFNKASALATNDIPVKIYPVNANSSLVMAAEVFGDYGLYYGSNIRAGLSSTFAAYTAISSLTGTSLIIDYH